MGGWTYNYFDYYVEGFTTDIGKQATSMLVTDVGDEISWSQLCDLGDRFFKLKKTPT